MFSLGSKNGYTLDPIAKLNKNLEEKHIIIKWLFAISCVHSKKYELGKSKTICLDNLE